VFSISKIKITDQNKPFCHGHSPNVIAIRDSPFYIGSCTIYASFSYRKSVHSLYTDNSPRKLYIETNIEHNSEEVPFPVLHDP